MPGGANSMQCTLQVDARFRTDALNPGRLVRIIRGGSIVWAGKLLEPQPNSDNTGWTVTGQGAGTFGANYAAYYPGNWNAAGSTPDDMINLAIGRGLAWTNPGINGVTGLYTNQQVDSAQQLISDLLNLVTQNGGLTWYVTNRHDGNHLSMFPIPTVPTRILSQTTPVGRTLGGDYNRVWLRYQVSADGAKKAVFDTTFSENAASEAQYGQLEAFTDLSSGGQMSQGLAQFAGAGILAKYQRASWGSPFTIQQGQLRTIGGQPVDLGMEQAAGVYQLVLTDYAYGGEVTAGAGVSFPVGGYAYAEETQTATVTPFQSLFTNFASLMSQITSVTKGGHTGRPPKFDPK